MKLTYMKVGLMAFGMFVAGTVYMIWVAEQMDVNWIPLVFGGVVMVIVGIVVGYVWIRHKLNILEKG